MIRGALPILVLLTAILGSTGWAANLLINGDFETPPYGVPEVPGWNWWGASADDLFDGVFDSTWNVPPPCSPTDPSNYGPHGGLYFLGKYYKPYTCIPPGPSRRGALYQIVGGLTPGTTYYAQAWFATHHPHGGGAGFRLGIDPNPGPNPSKQTVWDPPLDPIWGDKFGYSEGTYRKLEASVTAGESGAVAVWLQYTMTTNNVSEPQIVQGIDAAGEPVGQIRRGRSAFDFHLARQRRGVAVPHLACEVRVILRDRVKVVLGVVAVFVRRAVDVGGWRRVDRAVRTAGGGAWRV